MRKATVIFSLLMVIVTGMDAKSFDGQSFSRQQSQAESGFDELDGEFENPVAPPNVIIKEKIIIKEKLVPALSESVPPITTPSTKTLRAANPKQRLIVEVAGVVFETKACSLSKTRVISCRLVITSKFQDRRVALLGGGNVKVQDDAGNSYPVSRIGFGRNSETLNGTSMLIADTPYEATLEVHNVSTQATKVRALNVNRVDINPGGSHGFVFAHPTMTTSLTVATTPETAP